MVTAMSRSRPSGEWSRSRWTPSAWTLKPLLQTCPKICAPTSAPRSRTSSGPSICTTETEPRSLTAALVPWFDSWDPNAGYYWRRLREYLVDRKGWNLREVDDLNASSNRVLRHIEDPRVDGPHSKQEFRVQGLVLGYVQSGKTANFTSLIAKAADRGYRLIIVLSGIHNSLRAQTQRRLDLELGLVADPKGVGRPDQRASLVGDHQRGPEGRLRPAHRRRPTRPGRRGIMVVKKNATVLRRLVNWLDGEVPADLAALIIDDEADQASINTQPSMEEADLGDDTGDVAPDKELDPSTINGLIRDLIGKFRRASYVAYTATPFANVLINPDAESDRWGSDLFPKEFIISLPRPAAYVGAERIFGRPALEDEDDDIAGLDVVRIVPDSEMPDLVPRGRAAAASWEPVVTDSLRAAMLDWILATAGQGSAARRWHLQHAGPHHPAHRSAERTCCRRRRRT